MDKELFEKVSEILGDAYALDVDDYLAFPSFSMFDGDPFMQVSFADDSDGLEFSEDNNSEIEILSRDPLILEMRDVDGERHTIKPLMLARL